MARFFLLGMLVFSFGAHASNQSLNEITNLVEEYVREMVLDTTNDDDFEIKAVKIDSRVRLKPCEGRMIPELTHGTINRSRVTVTVSCDSESWHLRVPVEVKRYKEVVFAKTTIQRGDVVHEQDVDLMRVDASRLSQFFDDAADVLGKQAKRSINQGRIIKPNMVQEPMLIKRGAQVKMVITLPGLEITSQGVAKTNGHKGEFIEVTNLSSQKEVQALVIGENVVQVTP